MRRALLVGIDDYDNFDSLGGCVNDVSALLPLFARNEDASPNFECAVLQSDVDRVDRDSVLEAVDHLLAAGGEFAILYFAGHGGQSDSDVTLVTQDGTERSPGIPFSEVLASVQQSPVQEVVILLDCCFAGGAGQVPQFGGEAALLRPGVTIVAASRPTETSAESEAGRGLFSTFLEGALEGGAADVLGAVTSAGTYSYLSESFGAWEQRPTFKANVERLRVLRQCEPAVPLVDLRELPALFPTPTHELQLDPSFEPTEDPHDDEHERIMKLLQRCRAAKLVEPIEEDHLYFAAMRSGACRLTRLGIHYRYVAEREWI